MRGAHGPSPMADSGGQRVLHMSLLALIATAMIGATQVWTASSLANVYPSTEPPTGAEDAVRLYAARGEWESFQLCIRSPRKALEQVDISCGPAGKWIAPPSVRVVDYTSPDRPSGRACSDAFSCPDPLVDFVPMNLPPDQTRALWVTYHVPADAKPGVYTGTIDVRLGKRSKRTVTVTIEVFDFALPDVPSLRSGFLFDRQAIRDTYGIQDESLAAWRPIYDALAASRISYCLADDGSLVRVAESGAIDTSLLKEHLEYAVSTSAMNTINPGWGDKGIMLSPTLAPEAPLDPVHAYLQDMGDWLDERGWLGRVCLQPCPRAPRSRWLQVQAASRRIRQADPRVSCMLVEDPHPSLEQCADTWAVSLRHFDPIAHGRVMAGLSLAARPAVVPQRVTASSTGTPPGRYVSAPEDACDGSMYTYWLSESAPGARSPQWVQFDFERPVTTDNLRVGWVLGHEPEDIRVRTSFDGTLFSTTPTTWDDHYGQTLHDQSWSEARFKFERTFVKVRLEFRGSRHGFPVGVNEVEFVGPPEDGSVGKTKPAELWLRQVGGDFPLLAADVHPAEARLLAWVCRAHGMTGFTGGYLNAWPAEWRDDPQAAAARSGAGAGENVLFYPGIRSPLPSIRAERLRDGIEDYDYLKIAGVGTADGSRLDKDGLDLGLVFSPDMTAQQLDEAIVVIQKKRIEIGRALTRAARENSHE